MPCQHLSHPTMLRPLTRFGIAFLAIALAIPLPANSQIIQGRLVERETGIPIDGALVVLVGEHDKEIDGYLTNPAGRFRLWAGTAGQYTVRADRIGFETVMSESLQLENGQVLTLLLETEQVPISLAELTVRGEQECRVRPEEGLELSRVWDEARKALAVQDWTERENLYEYLVTNYERETDYQTQLVLSEKRESTTKVARIPIRSLPARDLMEEGFIRELEEGGFQYYGPDASVLLSDIFLDSHCFRLTNREGDPSSIGLRFEPAEAGGLPDIAGTLWLDRTTSELQTLEFWYTWAPYPEGAGYGRGLIEFERMPNGAWIVRKWWIRMPNVTPWRNPVNRRPTEYRLSTLTEAGGETRQAFSVNRPLLEEAATGFVSGVVWDSIAGLPLEGATVFLSGTSLFAATDSLGRFLMEDVPEGLFQAVFTHPQLDFLGIVVPGIEVKVTLDKPASVQLGTPSVETILAGRCGESEEDHRAVAGTVLMSGTENPIPEATVEAKWRGLNNQGIPTVESVRTVTDVEGRFVLCQLPRQKRMEIHASLMDREGDPVQISADVDPPFGLDLGLDLPPGTLNIRASVADTEGLRGAQGIQGRILEPTTGNPVRNAEIIVRRPFGNRVETTVTNAQGFFRVSTLQPGVYAVRATALGYQEVQAPDLEVTVGRMVVLEIEMPPEPLDLEPIIVVAEPREYHLEVQGFYEREEQGFGHFFTPEELEERQPLDWEDLLRPIPNIHITRTAYGSGFMVRKPLFGTGSPGLCEPRLVVDGFPVPPTRRRPGAAPQGIHLDRFVSVSNIAGIEVHLRATSVPLQYGGSSGSCGVILVWTKGG